MPGEGKNAGQITESWLEERIASLLLLKNNIDNIIRRAGRTTFPAAATAFLTLALVAGCGSNGGAGGDGRLKVVADIVPIADFCREIGGEAVEVELLVPPGANPHAYELTTGQMRFLEEADVVVVAGLGLTPWAEEIFATAAGPEMLTVLAGEAVPVGELIEAVGRNGSDGDKEEGHQIYDPHIWLDPTLAVDIVAAIRDGLVEADPENATSYERNADRYIQELSELDGEITQKVASFTTRKFVAFHSSWTYFARRYGLEQVGVIEELPGKEPSAGEIADLVELIGEQGVKVVFAETQFSPRAAEAIAEESGGEVIVMILDPLGDPEDPEWDTYIKMMKKNVETMEEALR
jgi:zinc transport system substrate-binding protein